VILLKSLFVLNLIHISSFLFPVSLLFSRNALFYSFIYNFVIITA